MTKRLLVMFAFAVLARGSGAEKRTIPCKMPANASSCYMTHGRLAIYQGAVNWRLWKIGTNNLLGIFSGPAAMPTRYETDDSEAPQLPTNVERAFASVKDPYEIRLFADFEVCPLEPHIEGHMQAACIESATHVFVKK